MNPSPAWYSQRSVDHDLGSSIYVTAEGVEVEVTCVGDGASYLWPDKVYVGVVVAFVRQGKLSRWDAEEGYGRPSTLVYGSSSTCVDPKPSTRYQLIQLDPFESV